MARPCPPLRGPGTAGRGPAPPSHGRGSGPQGSSSGKPGGDCTESGGPPTGAQAPPPRQQASSTQRRDAGRARGGGGRRAGNRAGSQLRGWGSCGGAQVRGRVLARLQTPVTAPRGGRPNGFTCELRRRPECQVSAGITRACRLLPLVRPTRPASTPPLPTLHLRFQQRSPVLSLPVLSLPPVWPALPSTSLHLTIPPAV
ncbi:uncharacterized protein WM277_021082 [Molossus nigricans]